MAERYRNAVRFFVVYIREAHPTDGWQVPANIRDGVLLPSAQTQADKDGHADMCAVKLGIQFPTLVDKMDNRVELAYAGWPDRLYLIGRDGRIEYKSRIGPAGFIPAELDAAIKKSLTAHLAP